MDSVLSGLKGSQCLVYMDDIIVFGRDEHVMRLREVFQRLRESGLTLKPAKCRFLEKEVDYLGHVMSAEGVKPDPNKISVIAISPALTLNTIRSFLGLVGYYRRFIPDFEKMGEAVDKEKGENRMDLRGDRIFRIPEESAM